MKADMARIFVIAGILFAASAAHAQKLPEAGYIYPPGGKVGTTIDVRLAGYDWTPDMEFFVHDKRIQLTPTGPLGPILIPGPPYWLGAKGRLVSNPLPREVPAKLIIPADFPPGPVYWQAANANGTTSVGVFVVSNGLEVLEEENRNAPQLLSNLPLTVSGRIGKIEEVDRYKFTAAKNGPITCDLTARRIGAKFLGILEVREASGRLVVDAAGTNGTDPCVTFAAKAGTEYIVSINDIDFGGDRSYVYRLHIAQAPRVVGVIPAAGKRGETQEVELVGYGIASGSGKLESVKRQVTFPANGERLEYRLETPFGNAAPFAIPLNDQTETTSNVGDSEPGDSNRAGPAFLTEAAAITGVLDQADTEDRYYCVWKKGDVWSLAVEAKRFGSPLDVNVAIIGPDGKEVARNEDLPETTDAGLDFTVPVDGMYQIVVSDMAGKCGTRAAIYRLVVGKPAEPDFELQIASPRFSVPMGGRSDLLVKAIRKHGFKGPITLSINGLPEGINVHPVLIIPAIRDSLLVSLHADRDMGTQAAFITVEGTGANQPDAAAPIPSRGKGKAPPPPKKTSLPKKGTVAAPVTPPAHEGERLTRTASVRTTVNLAPRTADENEVSTVLVAATLKPLFTGRPVDADTGRKVHRGSTFPADVIVERFGDWNGEVILQMAAQQSYQVQGITGGDVIVPPGVGLAIYPCFMPEWLETSRTSRMGMFAVAKVQDPQGKTRWIANEVKGFITMTLEGALMKVFAEEPELTVPAGQPFDVHLKVSRVTKLSEPVKLELRLPEELAGQMKAEPVTVAVGQESVVVRVTPAANLRGSHTFTIRGTAIQDGKYPAISEANVSVELMPVASR